jgi:flagellar motor protein MotB
VIDGAAKFKPKRAEPTPELERQLRLVARLLGGQLGSSVLIVEAYPDRPRDAGGEALAVQRAAAIRRLLVSEGLPEKRITAASGDLATKRAADAPQFDFTVVRSNEP